MKTMWDPPKNRFFSDKFIKTGMKSNSSSLSEESKNLHQNSSKTKSTPSSTRRLLRHADREVGEVHSANARTTVTAAEANAALVNAKLEAKEMDRLASVDKHGLTVTGSDIDNALKANWDNVTRGEKDRILENLLRVRVEGNKAKELKTN